MSDLIIHKASGSGGFAVIIIWAVIALISFLVKRKQAVQNDDWEEGWEDTPAKPAPTLQPKQKSSTQPQSWNQQSKERPQNWNTQNDRQPQNWNKQNEQQNQSWNQNKPVPPPPVPAALQRSEQQQMRGQQDAARAAIQKAIARQKKTDSVPPPPMPAAGMVNLGDMPGMPAMPSGISSQPKVLRRRKGARINARSAKAWRQAFIMREVLERPRAYDT